MKKFVILALLSLLTLVLAAGPVLAAAFDRTFTLDSRELRVANLIGSVEVKASPDSDFHVEVRVQGDDAEESLLDFHVEEGSRGQLVVGFPVDEHRKYVYPAMGRGSKTEFRMSEEDAKGERSWLKKVFGGFSGKKITVRGKGSGIEMWADMVIQVPAGRELELEHGVGHIEATGVEADLDLNIKSGRIEGLDIKGDLVADTGSGSVKLENIAGEVLVDTGSGSVKVAGLRGGKVSVDTGSGSVDARDIQCQFLHIDTGSGSVEAREVRTDGANIDTGSGSVLLQLDRMGPGKYRIDTGSGGITIDMPDDASARILADTGSGSIRNQLNGATINAKERGELDMTVGDGENRVVLDAGSGSITIK
jgi:hypothetical protein